MIPRRPLAPNNRQGRMSEFLKTLESVAPAPYREKANEQPSVRIWARRGRQNSEGFGGGNRVTR